MGSTKEKTPKAYSLILTKHTLQNINEITEYIAYIKLQPLNAIRVGDKLLETIERISQNPLIFKECEAIPTKTKIYRKAICMSWYIIFKIKATRVIVLGIIHSSRRVSIIRKLRKIK